ncbi:hypothetical protein FOA52_014148 [Chlamydomonas sp. UWO 241]|nr:hypothetical protein FOA52_014148 [Chlamydomonas sp. UWO 241]
MVYMNNAVAYVAPGGAACPAPLAAVHMPATGIAAGGVLLAHPSTIPSAAAIIGYALIPGIGPLPFTAAAHAATPMDCDAHTSLYGHATSEGAVVPAHANATALSSAVQLLAAAASVSPTRANAAALARASRPARASPPAAVASVTPSRASTRIRERQELPTRKHKYQDGEEPLTDECAYSDGEELPTFNLECLPPMFDVEDMHAAQALFHLNADSSPNSSMSMDHDIRGAFSISSDGGAASGGGGASPIDSSGDERIASRKRERTAAGSSGGDELEGGARAPTNKRPRSGTYVPAVERARASAPRAASPGTPPAPPKPPTPMQKQKMTDALIFISSIPGVSTLEGPVRRLLGNSPDTSIALRHMRSADLVTCTGEGGKKDPLVWTLTPAGMAAAAATAAAAAAAVAGQVPSAVAPSAAAAAGP